MLKKNFATEQKKGLEIKIGDRVVHADPKVFKGEGGQMGSVGFYLNVKIPVTLDDGSQVNLQLGGNFVVTKSKEMTPDTDLTTGLVVEPEKAAKVEKKADAPANGQSKVKLTA